MLAYLAMIGAMPANEQPMFHSPRFDCTPTWFHADTGVIGCREALTISLWGVTFPSRTNLSVAPSAYEAGLREAFGAPSVQARPGGYFYLINALPMNCFSPEARQHRVAQCIVQTGPLFGGKELACAMIHVRIAKPTQLTKKIYAGCQFDRPQLMLG